MEIGHATTFGGGMHFDNVLCAVELSDRGIFFF